MAADLIALYDDTSGYLADDDYLADDLTRTTITWWAPFDRVAVLTALAVCGGVPLVWSPVLPVRIVSAVIVAIAVTTAVVTLVRELKTVSAGRGISVTETAITGVFPGLARNSRAGGA